MTTMRWFRTGGPGRGAPTGRVPKRARHWALALLAVIGMAQQGCAALGIGNGCGPCGLSGWRPRLFHRDRAADCCTPGGLPAADFGGAPAVVAPGAVMPAPPGAVDELTPIPPAGGSGAAAEPGASSRGTSGTSGTSAAGKANYEALRYPYRAGSPRGANLARALVPSEPARRPAPRASSRPSTNPLDNLPPLSLPIEPTSSDGGSRLPAPAEALPPAAEEVSKASLPPARALLAPPDATPSAGDAVAVAVAPGIERFQGVDPNLAGGSLPSLTGLDWLVDKGYKTVLDLREPGPEQPAFISEVVKRGLRYLPLPISAESIDADHVGRFNAELEQASARPLYFFDTRGDRAGALWYIRRLTVDSSKVDAKTAAQEAKDLGLSDHALWLSANAYLAHLATVKTTPVPNAETAPAPVSTPAAGPEAPTTPAPEPADEKGVSSPMTTSSVPRDPTAWKPYAALIVTALGVPLAFWGRCSLFSLGSFVRASLPGPARTPRALPPSSGA